MQTHTRLVTAVIFGSVTFLATFALLFQNVPEIEQTLLSQLSPLLVYEMLWQPVLLALLLGAASGRAFEKVTRLRLGVLYAALLGFLLSLPVLYLNVWHFGEVTFALTLTAFEEKNRVADTAVAMFSGPVDRTFLERLVSQLSLLLGPLTGVSVWALLRRSRQLKTP